MTSCSARSNLATGSLRIKLSANSGAQMSESLIMRSEACMGISTGGATSMTSIAGSCESFPNRRASLERLVSNGKKQLRVSRPRLHQPQRHQVRKDSHLGRQQREKQPRVSRPRLHQSQRHQVRKDSHLGRQQRETQPRVGSTRPVRHRHLGRHESIPNQRNPEPRRPSRQAVSVTVITQLCCIEWTLNQIRMTTMTT